MTLSDLDHTAQLRYADPALLKNFARDVLTTYGVTSADAELVAGSLVQADLWGHQSHGVLRLPWYTSRLASQAMNACVEPDVVKDHGPVLVLDGRAGMGQVMADRAQKQAVARAREHGIGAVAVRNSNHFGTAMYFTRRAAAQGCVAILTTNASPAMAPWGGREKRVGTNPWSIAAPFGDSAVALDIANTAVARGKIYLARQKGLPIPETWAITHEGEPTTDAAEAVNGVILPMAGHKGYAISFMMDVLSGVLAGSETGTKVHGPYEPTARGGAGHLFIALDVGHFRDPADFGTSLDGLVKEMKSTPTAKGVEEIFYPGELEDRSERKILDSEGLALPQQTWDDLTALSQATSIPMNIAR